MVQDTQFVTGGLTDNFFNLAGQYLNYRGLEKQAEANGKAQQANFAAGDTTTRAGAEPVPVSEQKAAAAAGNNQKQMLMIGGGIAAAVVLVLLLKK